MKFNFQVVTFVPDSERGVTIDFYLMSGIETGQPQQANIVQLKPSQMVRKTPSFRELNDGGRKRRSSEEGLDSKEEPPSVRFNIAVDDESRSKKLLKKSGEISEFDE